MGAFTSNQGDFEVWCLGEAGGLNPFPASSETVALYITDLAANRALKASTIQMPLGRVPGLLVHL